MKIGITGSIAMGKSLVANYIVSKGFRVIDTDLISKEIIDYPEVINEIKSYFGDNILDGSKINRKLLASKIFNNDEDRLFLNYVIHPLVLKRVRELTTDDSEIVFIDIPLLFEAGFDKHVEKIVVVYTSSDVQLRRLIQRDKISEEYAIRKINSQLDIEVKKIRADYIIDNNFDRAYTKKQIDEILWRLKIEI